MSPKEPKYKWKFINCFRKGAYQWNGTAKASKRLKEALSEIKKRSKVNPSEAAEGAIKLIEKIVPSIESIDSSSGVRNC